MKLVKKVLTVAIIFILLVAGFFAWKFIFFHIDKHFFLEKRLLNATNNWRLEQSLPELITEQNLCKLADSRSKEIIFDWSHNGFHEKSMDFIEVHKIDTLGENLYEGSSINEYEILQMWLDSKTHKDNIVYPYTHTCLKCNSGFCVHLFANYL